MKIEKGDFICSDFTGMKGIVKGEGIICKDLPVYKVKTALGNNWIVKKDAKLVEGANKKYTTKLEKLNWLKKTEVII